MGEIQDLQKLIEEFAKERDWEKYHTAKNLVLALGSEIGELQAEFRWLMDNEELTEEKLEKIKNEIADVGIFLLRIADILKIDLNETIRKKIKINSNRIVRGTDFIN
jgi:NTP pyrophosphatase (non-canonical NTP hydrolase)